jgi:hypothetical protein
VRLVSNKRDDHAVQVEEEHDEVEAELEKAFLLVHVQFPEDLGRVEEVLVVHDPVKIRLVSHVQECGGYFIRGWGAVCAITYFFAFHARRGRFSNSAIQYPLMRKRKVKKAWTAASGMM